MAKKEKGMIKSIIDKVIYGFGLLVVFALFCGFFIPGSEEDTNNVAEASATTNNNNQELEDDIVELEPEELEDEEDNSVSFEFKNALVQAKIYNQTMSFSKQGLFDQLTSPYGGKFPDDAAQYAIDNLNADWNENALKQAENYSNLMGMSKQALFDQLTSPYGDKFTDEEAQYAIDNLE